MTGSDMGGLIVGFGAIMAAIWGVIVLVIGMVVSIFSFQWWIFAIAGVLFLISSLGWIMLKQSEKRYYANQEACERRVREHQQESK